MKETLRQVRPDGIEDLSVCNALFRPASLKFIEHYAKRKHGKEKFEYLHPDLEGVLKPTYGILIFQEQLIEIGRIAGLRNPDAIRKATAKKKMELMIKVRDELFEGLRKRSWSEDQLSKLWDIMVDFASYSFNKSHATAYAITAWQMAKLKVYHPVEFMTALLNSKIGKIEEISQYVNECKRMGINVLPPNINESKGNFTIKDNNILFGLLAIKGIGEPSVNTIEKMKKACGQFNSFKHFYNLMNELNEKGEIESLPTDTIVNLIKSGAFGSNKDELLLELAELTYTPLQWKPKKTIPNKKDFTKAGFTISDEDFENKEKRKEIFNNLKYQDYLKEEEKRKLKHINNFTDKYVGNFEYYEFDTTGTYLTVSPFDKYLKHIKDFYSYEDGTEKILVVGTLLDKQVKKSSNGGQYAKLQLLTPYGVVQTKIYSNQYNEYKKLLEKGNTIVTLAKRNKDEAIVSKLKTFDEWKEIINKNKKGR